MRMEHYNNMTYSGLEFTNRCGWVCVGLDGQYIVLYSFEHYVDTRTCRYTLGEYFYDIICAKRKSGRKTVVIKCTTRNI